MNECILSISCERRIVVNYFRGERKKTSTTRLIYDLSNSTLFGGHAYYYHQMSHIDIWWGNQQKGQ